MSKSAPKSTAAQTRRYLASQSADSRRHVTKLRDIIRATAPRAVPVISYGIPAFTLDGRVLIYYAGWREHVSVYPMTDRIRRAHASALKVYRTSKGTVQLPLAKPLPVALIRKLVKARIAEVRAKGAKRTWEFWNAEGFVPPYKERFPIGVRVRIAPREQLEAFRRNWRFHHPLAADQLAFGGQDATVGWVGFYHDGDILYTLVDVPGIWHERCLMPAEPITPET